MTADDFAGDELESQICAAIGVNPANVQRVVIDLDAASWVKIYVEMVASKRFLSVDWDLLGRADIIILDKE